MFKRKEERERQKQLKHLTEIAAAFLKARGVYPVDYNGFLEVAGQKEVDVFYQTMHLVEKGATKWGYTFDWYYDQKTNEWVFVFTDKGDAVVL